MGRNKSEIKKKTVTFGKRRRGLFKKAAQLALLCDAKINIILSDDLGNYTQFNSTNQKSKLSTKMGVHSLFTIEHYTKYENSILRDKQQNKQGIKTESMQEKQKEMVINYPNVNSNSVDFYFDYNQQLENIRLPSLLSISSISNDHPEYM